MKQVKSLKTKKYVMIPIPKKKKKAENAKNALKVLTKIVHKWRKTQQNTSLGLEGIKVLKRQHFAF